jgi:hypothetical protein
MSNRAKPQDSCSKATAITACCILMLLAGASAGVAATEQKPLTNDDVVSMVQAGLSPDIVIEKIKLSKNSAFDTSPEVSCRTSPRGARSTMNGAPSPTWVSAVLALACWSSIRRRRPRGCPIRLSS